MTLVKDRVIWSNSNEDPKRLQVSLLFLHYFINSRVIVETEVDHTLEGKLIWFDSHNIIMDMSKDKFEYSKSCVPLKDITKLWALREDEKP